MTYLVKNNDDSVTVTIDKNDLNKLKESNDVPYNVTDEVRSFLSNQVEQTRQFFMEQFERWPDIPGVAKITLKDEALAKSHRPTALLRSRTCPIIGTLDFGEILVSASNRGLNLLAEEIRTTNSKASIANIFAIEKIEPYRIQENRAGFENTELNAFLKQGIPLKIRTFDHGNINTNLLIKQKLVEFAREQGIELKEIHYGTRCSVFKTTSENEKISKQFESFIGLQSIAPMPSFGPADIEFQSCPIGIVMK